MKTIKNFSRVQILILAAGIVAAVVVNGAIAMQARADHERAIAAMPVVRIEPIVIYGHREPIAPSVASTGASRLVQQ